MRARKNTKKGFTLIEVILFLAISSAVLIAILAGTGRSLAQQRYNDSVQDISSFLQSQYSSVINVRNSSGRGNADLAIYGKLIVFNDAKISSSGGSIIDSYEVVGRLNNDKDTTAEAFDTIGLAIVCAEKESYTSQWGATVEKTDSHSAVTRTIAILRSPINGTIYTYRSRNEEALVTDSNCASGGLYDFLTGASDATKPFSSKFEKIPSNADTAFNICIYTKDEVYGGKRRNIRISNTNSVNSIQLVPLDDGVNNKCQ